MRKVKRQNKTIKSAFEFFKKNSTIICFSLSWILLFVYYVYFNNSHKIQRRIHQEELEKFEKAKQETKWIIQEIRKEEQETKWIIQEIEKNLKETEKAKQETKWIIQEIEQRRIEDIMYKEIE